MTETLVWISLGSNLGDREANLRGALEALDDLSSCRLDKCSQIYETAPWGDEDQPPFLNAACGLICSLAAAELLAQLQQIENNFQRTRLHKWGPRTLDLDIIRFGEEQITTKTLTIPHPLFKDRQFVLQPIAEIYGDISINGKTANEWLALLNSE